MEVMRKIIDANRLMSIMSLPEALKNRKLEIIVLPAEDCSESSEKDVEVADIVNSLIGVLPDNGMSLSEYRAERLGKYEAVD